jgi:hypothetical protein
VNLVLVAALAVELGAGFLGGSVTGEPIDDTTIRVDLEVEVAPGEAPVVAHLALPGAEDRVEALVERAPGRWGAVIELRRADWRVVFESVSTGRLSRVVSLTALGLELELVEGRSTPPPVPLRRDRWAPLALSCAAAASVIVVVVVIDDRTFRPRHLRSRRRSRRSGRS